MTASVPAPEYFSQARRDVAALIPETAAKILDVGCGYGGLGRLLTMSRRIVHGIERNPAASSHLHGIYARFVIGDAAAGLEELRGERYDCIVFADILEHLVDPWAVLARAGTLLAPDGVVVASIPNVRNIAVIFDLLFRGRWHYAESGLLDRTHLRFFTRSEIYALFDSAGLRIEQVHVNRDRFRPVLRILAALPVLLIPDLGVCQFIVRGRRSSRGP